MNDKRNNKVRKIFQLSPETWIAIGSLLIALCALVHSLYDSHLNRHHQRLSAKPHINIGFYYNEEGAGWILGNWGIGPAIIEWFEVKVDGIPKSDWLEVGGALNFKNSPDFQFTVPRSGTMIRPDVTDRIFWIPPGSLNEELLKNRERVSITACYSSLYQEFWLESDEFTHPKRVNSCAPKPTVEFNSLNLVK
jgi:hypothetical protein